MIKNNNSHLQIILSLAAAAALCDHAAAAVAEKQVVAGQKQQLLIDIEESIHRTVSYLHDSYQPKSGLWKYREDFFSNGTTAARCTVDLYDVEGEDVVLCIQAKAITLRSVCQVRKHFNQTASEVEGEKQLTEIGLWSDEILSSSLRSFILEPSFKKMGFQWKTMHEDHMYPQIERIDGLMDSKPELHADLANVFTECWQFIPSKYKDEAKILLRAITRGFISFTMGKMGDSMLSRSSPHVYALVYDSLIRLATFEENYIAEIAYQFVPEMEERYYDKFNSLEDEWSFTGSSASALRAQTANNKTERRKARAFVSDMTERFFVKKMPTLPPRMQACAMTKGIIHSIELLNRKKKSEKKKQDAIRVWAMTTLLSGIISYQVGHMGFQPFLDHTPSQSFVERHQGAFLRDKMTLQLQKREPGHRIDDTGFCLSALVDFHNMVEDMSNIQVLDMMETYSAEKQRQMEDLRQQQENDAVGDEL